MALRYAGLYSHACYLRELGVVFMWTPQVTADDLWYMHLSSFSTQSMFMYMKSPLAGWLLPVGTVVEELLLLQISVETDIIMWLFTVVPKH